VSASPTPVKSNTPTIPQALQEVEVVFAAIAAAGSGWTEVANLMHNTQASADVSIALAVVAAVLVTVRSIMGGVTS
jgi:hypothetical protein